MRKLIVIADYASDNLSCQEVKTVVEGYLKNPLHANISFVSSTPKTIHTSFLLSQAVEVQERYGQPQETVIFVNCDPRLDVEKARRGEGADGLIILLASGIYLLGPNAGYSFSLIKDRLREVYKYEPLKKGGQFRSRDKYGRVIAHLMDYLEDQLELEEREAPLIPDLHGFYVGHIDNYDNIKTTIKKEDFKGKFKYQDMVKIKIGRVTREAKFVENLFADKPGRLVIYPGSSGRPDNPYLEVSVWRHFDEAKSETGSGQFGSPRPGDKIQIKTA